MTALADYRISAPRHQDEAATTGLHRFTRSVGDAFAILTNAFAFARAMESAHTPAERQRVLDRF